ncbi:MAG: hypothetical protein KY453_08880 [Gemmatimonadetes bacterium]|nr:hypothetical protein [Gemmatimonadota bacterium]
MAIYHSDGIEIRRPPRNPWRDAILGMAGGVLGTMAMNRFWQALAAALPDDEEAERAEEQRRESSGDGPDTEEREGPLDDISVVGPFNREEESAPETMGRVAYTKLYGEEPSDETRGTRATEIHWATGLALGGLYGLLRGDARDGLDLGGGLLFGAGAWLMNDEVLVPMLGLSDGPTAQEPAEHVKALGAHVVYGLATAAATQALERVF